MRHRVLRYGLICLLPVVAVACSSRSTAPTAPTSVQPTAPPPAPPGNVSAVYGAAVTASQYPLSGYTAASQLVLRDNGSFALELSTGEYKGTYTQSDNQITFQWEGWSAAGPWGATGTLAGDKLTVHYNLIMQLTDFEDATYTRVQ